MEQIFMVIGFILAAYSVVGNDVIQTLGTFLSSNSDKKWYWLWAYTTLIMLSVLAVGWWQNDIAYGRLDRVVIPLVFHWWYVLPPLILLFITRLGVPVSTTFLVLSVFSMGSFESVWDAFGSDQLISKMLIKSGSGYVIAFAAAAIIYLLITSTIEKYFINNPITKKQKVFWTIIQWLSAAALWTSWLMQDLANIYVYLPRKEELSLSWFIFSIIVLSALQAYTFYNRGGNIQKVVTSKTNTTDVRSASIINFFYAAIMIVFKEINNIPMSTTWLFVGLLAGREFIISILLAKGNLKKVSIIIAKDFFKIIIGLLVSVALVILIGVLR
jgi:hypothetical protein